MLGSSSTMSTRGEVVAVTVFSYFEHAPVTRSASNQIEGEQPMTSSFKRFGLGLGGSLIALALTAAVYASTQNTANGPAPFMRQRPPFGAMGGPGAFAPLGALASRL